jgi:flavin-dependent dehydrogenase
LKDSPIISGQRVKILGAGPSGLSAGLSLAKAGYEVEVYEKERRVGARFHGDIQGLGNWSDEMDVLERLSRMDLRINFDCRAFHRLTVSNMSREYIFTPAKPPFYLVKRGSLPGSLDLALLEQAEESGVCLRFGETIPEEGGPSVLSGGSLFLQTQRIPRP